MLQNDALFGIPLPFIGFGCFILAAVFFIVWPKSAAKDYKQISLRHYILHYFHSLAWVFLSTAAFELRLSAIVAAVLALLGIVVYVIFISTWVQARQTPK